MAYRIYNGETTLTEQIVLYLTDHPGAKRKDICISLGGSPNTVSSLLGRLSREGIVENRGGYGPNASWYLVNISSIHPKYHNLASNILEEMKKVHHTKRVDYLARRLHELC